MEEREQVPAYEDCLDYTPTARSVSLARRRAARLVTAWGHPELAGDAALLVSELATNALLHGCLRDRLFRVRITLGAAALRIEVTDPRGETGPSPRTAAHDEQFGRGLLLVEALADRWGTEPRTVGKVVYAELSIRAYKGDDGPVIPRPELKLPALRQAVATVAPSRLPEFFEELQQAFVRAGDEDSVVPIRMFYRRWGVVVEIERHPERAQRLHAAERAVDSPDPKARAAAILEAGEIVRAAHREVAGG
ncbi:ATP-binding protein [Streptomyces violascens]|uniref:ATP-binding protein n=1 Tax=Streptomyces violascens TaxID=67381 RepID=UPI00364B565A